MRQIGYVEGQNVRFEPRSAQGDHDRLQMLASELVGLTYGRGGRLRLIATLHDPAVIRKILAHLALGHSGQSPGPAPPGSGVAAS